MREFVICDDDTNAMNALKNILFRCSPNVA